jgi:hypothetical protein
MGPLRAAAWVTAVGAVACSSGLVPPNRPSRGGPAWYEVSGEHFVLRTDMTESDAARAAAALEQAYAELHAAGFPTADPRGPALHVVAFRDEAEMDRYWAPRHGFYSLRLPGDLEREPTIVMRAESSELLAGRTRIDFLHELTHRFTERVYGPVPPWLNEGLASFLSTIRVEGRTAVLGEIPLGVSCVEMPSVAELRAVEPRALDAEFEEDAREQLQRFYCGSWALVHFLMNGPDDERARFSGLLQKVRQGELFFDAWQATLGAVPLDKLEAEFAEYTRLHYWYRFSKSVGTIRGAPAGTPSRLSDVAVDIEWARLLGGRAKTSTIALGLLGEAWAREPGSSEVAYWLGSAALWDGRPLDARRWFESLLAREPDDPRVLYGLDVALAKGGTSAADTALRSGVLSRLEKAAKTPDQLDRVAKAEAARGDLDLSRRTALRVLQLDPGYYGAAGSADRSPMMLALRALERQRVEDREREQDRKREGRALRPTSVEPTGTHPIAPPQPRRPLPTHPSKAMDVGSIEDAMAQPAILVSRWRPYAEGYPSRIAPTGQRPLSGALVHFATYLNAMHNRLHPIFADHALAVWKRGKDREFRTARLELTLGADGQIVDMGVIGDSGSPLFDAMALESFARAAPFGVPPDDIRSGDGLVHLIWLLTTDEVFACTTMNARPFLLE